MNNLLQDLRYAVRLLLKSPGFSLVAVLTLALGIGANTAIFSVINAVLLRPLPFKDPSKVVVVIEKSDYPTVTVSYQNYLDWRDQSHSFGSMEAIYGANMTLTGKGDPERVVARRVTSGFFPMLGVPPRLGRNFSAAEDLAGGTPVAVLSYAVWQRLFAGSNTVLGTPVTLDSQSYTVVGVMPPGFQFFQAADVYLPFHPWAKTLPDDRDWHPGILPVARLKPGVTMAQARTEMLSISKRLEQQYPLYNHGKSSDVVLAQDQLVQGSRPALLLLLGAVGFVLLIVCVNVANLLLSRAASRGREIAIRTAMGAGQWRVVRQLLTESVLLSLAGAGLGLLLAWAALGPLLQIAKGTLPQTGEVGLDAPVLLFTGIVAILTGLLFGVVPALRTAKLDLRETLNEGSRGSTEGPGHHRVRNALVCAEFAMAVLLLVGAGLLLRSFSRMQDVQPGFPTDHLLVADIPVAPTSYPKPEQRFEFFDRLLESARNLPGVRAAGAANFLPVSGNGPAINFNIQGRPPKSPKEFTAAGYRAVTPGYFETMGVSLLRGRLFSAADREKAPPVAIINSSFARAYFPNENPLGKRMQIGATPEGEVPWMEIVGVVGDMRPGLGTDPQAEYYFPYQQIDALLPAPVLSIVLRTAMDPLLETSALRSTLSAIDPNEPLVNVRTMEINMAATVAQPRFRTWLIGIFAGLALVLAGIGVYGVMSYSVTQRTNEIGIRVTLGAQPQDVFRAVVGEALKLAFLGVGIGLVAALALTRLLQTFLYNISARDPWTFFGVALILILVGVAASYFPARRATRVDPLVALRYE